MPGHPLDGAAGIALGAAAAGGSLTLVALSSLHALSGGPLAGAVTAMAALSAAAWVPLMLGLRALKRPAMSAPGALRLGILGTGTALVSLNMLIGLSRALTYTHPMSRAELVDVMAPHLLCAGITWAVLWAGYRLIRARPALAVSASALPPLLALALGVAAPADDPDGQALANRPAAWEGGAEAPALLVVALHGVTAEHLLEEPERTPTLSDFAAHAARGRSPARVDGRDTARGVAYWTSVATGLPADEHGVGPVERLLPLEPVATVPGRGPAGHALVRWLADDVLDLVTIAPTRLHRGGEPFWSARGGRAAVICWPATWPARLPDGAMVADLRGASGDGGARVWPAGLEGALGEDWRSGSCGEVALTVAGLTRPEVLAVYLSGRAEAADERLAALLELVDDASTVVVLSAPGRGAGNKSVDGLVLVQGPEHSAGDALGARPPEQWNTLLIGGE